MIPLVMPHNAIAPQSSPYNIGEMVFVDIGVAVTFVPLIHVGANVTFPGGGLGASPAVTRAILRATCWVCVGGRGTKRGRLEHRDQRASDRYELDETSAWSTVDRREDNCLEGKGGGRGGKSFRSYATRARHE